VEKKIFIRKVKSAAKWSTFTEIITKLISPITNMILARLLAPDAFGVIAIITMIFTFVDMFTDSGFQKYLVQAEFKDDKEKFNYASVAFWTNLVLSIIFWIAISIFSKQLAFFVGNPGLGNVIIIACASLPLTAFSSIEMALFRRDFDFKSLFIMRIIAAFVPFLITIPLAMIYHNYWALIIGTICGNLSNVIILTIKSKWKPNLFYDIMILKKMFSFSMWSLLEAISIWLTVNVDIFILGHSLSDYYLGIYKISLVTVNQIMSVITTATTPILFSALSRLQNDDNEYNSILFKFQRMVGLIVFPMSVGIYMYRNFITDILLGSAWHEAANFIGLWGLVSGVTIIFCYYSSEVYRSKGKPKLSSIAQLLYIIILIPVLIYGLKYNFELLYKLRTLASLGFILIHMFIMSCIIKIYPNKIIKNVLPSITCSIIMGCFAYGLQKLANGIIWDLISIVLCIIFYFSILMLFPRIRKELVILVKPKINSIFSKINKCKECV
jgi:PST family polysaccharide transporter